MERYRELAAGVEGSGKKVACQLGTLGGGNHFIEVCLDTAETVWLMLHSGSRHIGAALAEHHIEIAHRLATTRRWRIATWRCSWPARAAFDAYRRDLFWAQDYAALQPRASCCTCCEA